MNKTLVVKEYDTIICDAALADKNGYVYLEEKYFWELDRFIREYSSQDDESDVLEFMKIGYCRGIGNTITFKNYVGIIELPSGFQIEVLPKVDLSCDEDNLKTKRIFLKMLSCLKEFEGKVFSSASLNIDKMNLYEVFVSMYVQEVRQLVKRGIKSAYIGTEDNLSFYKGKLDINKQIRVNAAHRERFYMHYDEYQVNRPENKLIKSTLLKLLRITKDSGNSKAIRMLLYSFELVDESVNYEKDFCSVSFTRDMKDYELLMMWSKVFLMNKSFTTFSGNKTGKALLFPMEQVFEAFIAKQLKNIFERNSSGSLNVSAQDSGYYLFDQPRRFKLRPDIVVRDKSNADNYPIILDTKWKRLSCKTTNYGISQSDMYQMYAYAKKYNTSDVWLIYPLNDNVDRSEPISFEAIKDEVKSVNVRVFFVDLADYQASIQSLYDSVYQS